MFYFNKFDAKNSIKLLGGIILFFDLLFIQALILKKGVIGNLFVNTLKAYIGVFGVIILIIIFGVWGMFLLFENKIIEFFRKKTKKNKIDIDNEENIEKKMMENKKFEKKIEVEVKKNNEEDFPLLDKEEITKSDDLKVDLQKDTNIQANNEETIEIKKNENDKEKS